MTEQDYVRTHFRNGQGEPCPERIDAFYALCRQWRDNPPQRMANREGL